MELTVSKLNIKKINKNKNEKNKTIFIKYSFRNCIRITSNLRNILSIAVNDS